VAGPKRPDEGEFVETVLLTEAELDALDARGELPDVKTLVGLRWLQHCRGGRRAWAWHRADEAASIEAATHASGL
jgi:ADP-ribose pyrophosphatase